jgi:hypothetical protein
MTNPEDYIDTTNNTMALSLVTTAAGASTTNSVSVWDFAMVSFSWVEDVDHPGTQYQFTPTAGTIITGASTTITSATLAATEGVNTGSWKGTLGDDNLHWVVAGENPGGLDMNLTLGGVQLNGANKLIIQTEIDLDATVLATLVQICDWVSNTSVDSAADSECTGGGWRTLNTKNASQAAVTLGNTAGIAFQWHVHNGYWSTGTTGGTAVDTPLTNFVNGSDEIKIRYYSTTNSTSQIAVDFLRIYPIVDPVYQANGFQKLSGGTVAGHYGNTFGIGNTSAPIQQLVTTGDGIYLDVPGTAATSSNFYLTFGNVKTYTGMNTILVNVETLCSAATANLQYRFKIHNFTLGSWEDISAPIDCNATGVFNSFAKNNISMDDYMNGSDEIWVGAYSLSTTTTNIRIDSIYLMLGTTNTDTNTCELTMGTTTQGRIVTNPSAPGADRIQALTTDGTYMYLGGYDTIGGDNEWRVEKRNLSDGALVTAFGVGGATTSDPSTGIDQIFAIATTSGAIFTAGYDLSTGAGQWRIEKRDITDGTLETAFDTDGIITFNPAADIDQITAIVVDDSYLYATGYEDDDTGVWRTHKYDITTGALVTAFDGDGIATSSPAATGDERPQTIKVDSDYLYTAGYDNAPGNIEWRIEKRNKTTGALCISGTECTAGAFGVGGVATSNPSANIDAIYAMAIDATHIYVAGYDSVVSATDGGWRIEKRDIVTGALDTSFDGDGIAWVNPVSGRIEWITALVVDDTYLYAGGYTNPANGSVGTWRIDKRDKGTGATTTAFSDNGFALSDDGSDDRLNAFAVDGGYVYAGGYGSGPTDNQWLIEKRDATTGLRVNSGFGPNDCTSTRDIDTTSDDSVPWMIRTQDESTSASSPFYGFDSDADATLEEASAATMEFSTALPTNAAVSGIYWAGRAMSGSAGTVRLGIRDYSGLTGTTGGRSLVGSSPASAMTYTDPLTVAGVATGGMSGYMTNPEDYIDTTNNTMALSLVTTAAGASTTNSVSVWDFAMVSFSWVEPVPVPVYSISITSDGSISYGFIDLNSSSSTVGGDTQTAENVGSQNEAVNVRSGNALGGTSWLLAGTVASDQYTHEFSTTTGAAWTFLPDDSTYVTADSFVTPSGTLDFDFRLTAPSGTTDFTEKSITVTVQAVAP